jgi:hypothetical protein
MLSKVTVPGPLIFRPRGHQRRRAPALFASIAMPVFAESVPLLVTGLMGLIVCCAR